MDGASPQPRASERLDSWKEIAGYLKREIRTVQRWEKSLGLPVRRLADQLGVFAYKSEIDAWWRERETKIREEDAGVDSAAHPNESGRNTGKVEETNHKQWTAESKARTRQRYVLVALALGLIVTVVVVRVSFPRIQQKFWPRTGRLVLEVAPFKNLSGDPQAQHIAEGLTEETITGLSRLHPRILGVVGLSPAAAAPGPKASRGDYLLQGTVRSAGQKVAITAQLILTKDQTRIWGNSYERNLQDPRDIIPIEMEVASDLANQTLHQLPQDSEPASKVNRDAYEAYLEGRFFWGKRTTESLTKALIYFEKAVQHDSTYAPAYAGLADCYSLLGSAPYTAFPPKEAWPKAETAARKALQFDSTLSEAHVSLGYSELVYRWDFANAEKEFQEAIRLRPAYTTAHQYYAYYLTAMGRLDDAISERQIARDLNPASPLDNSALGEAYYQARQYDRTIEQDLKSLELDPSCIVALVTLGRAYEQKGMYAEARAAFQRILAVAPDDPCVLALIGHVSAVSGHRTEAVNIISRLQRARNARYVPAIYIAMIYAGLNEKERAFEWLDKAYEERCEYLVYLPTEPMADPLRSDPRFSRLLNRLGLKRTNTMAASTAS